MAATLNLSPMEGPRRTREGSHSDAHTCWRMLPAGRQERKPEAVWSRETALSHSNQLQIPGGKRSVDETPKRSPLPELSPQMLKFLNV